VLVSFALQIAYQLDERDNVDEFDGKDGKYASESVLRLGNGAGT
jgi:hypothetical protein